MPATPWQTPASCPVGFAPVEADFTKIYIDLRTAGGDVAHQGFNVTDVGELNFNAASGLLNMSGKNISAVGQIAFGAGGYINGNVNLMRSSDVGGEDFLTVVRQGSAGIVLWGMRQSAMGSGEDLIIERNYGGPWFSMLKFRRNTGHVMPAAPNTAPTDADLYNGSITFYLDEAGNNLKVRVKYSNGTLKTATVALT